VSDVITRHRTRNPIEIFYDKYEIKYPNVILVVTPQVFYINLCPEPEIIITILSDKSYMEGIYSKLIYKGNVHHKTDISLNQFLKVV